MEPLLDGLCTAYFNGPLIRNIKSLRVSVDLFDDLAEGPDESELGNALRDSVHPDAYTMPPSIRRPFDLADYTQAISYPFKHWNESRYSNGSFGVWYGADTLQTSISETVYHWTRWLSGLSFLPDFASAGDPVTGERKVYSVHCDALLLDLRPKIASIPQLVDPDSYLYTQQLGDRLKHEGHPGLLTHSARCTGDISALFTPAVLSNPQAHCYLTYSGRIGSQEVVVERGEGEVIEY